MQNDRTLKSLLLVLILMVLLPGIADAQSPTGLPITDEKSFAKRVLDELMKELDINHTVLLQMGKPTVFTYVYGFEHPIGNRLRVSIGPQASLFQKQEKILLNWGGRAELLYYPLKNKGAVLRLGYSGMDIRYTPDTLEVSQVGYRGELLIGGGYELRVASLLYVQLGLLRAIALGRGSPLRGNPWDVSFSLRMDLPFVDLNKENMNIPPSKVNLSEWMKLGAIANLIPGASLGFELAPSLLRQWGKSKQGQLGLSGLLRYAPSDQLGDWLYGGRTWSRYRLQKSQPYYAQLEFESLNGAYRPVGKQELQRGWSHAALIGGGYGVSIGEGVSFSIQVSRRLRFTDNILLLNPWDVRFSYQLPIE